MDYTKGAIDLSSAGAVSLIVDRLGPQSPAPNGAYFSNDHLRSLLADGSFYALSTSPEDDMAFKYLEAYIKLRIWVTKVGDCDNRANDALSDLTQAAKDLGWKANAMVFVISYVSKRLGKNQGPWDGYHAALLVVKWNAAKKDFEVWIVEPKTEWESGATAPELWQTPEEEVKKWVLFMGR